jgi:predicted RNA-binding protein associated with RNAse of E/G family
VSAEDDFTFELIRLPDRRYTFHSTLLAADERRIVLAHTIQPSKPLLVAGEEVLAAGYHAVWFLYKGEPWDIGRLYRPDGTWTGYYVDVLERVRWEGADPTTLAPLVDLFLDVWITPAGECLLLDEDELVEATQAGAISTEQAGFARHVAQNLLQGVERGAFPTIDVRRWMGRVPRG